MTRTVTRLATIVLLAVALGACDEPAAPTTPDRHTGVVASGHPEMPPIMYQRGAVMGIAKYQATGTIAALIAEHRNR